MTVSLSVLVPVFNEKYLVAPALARLEALGESPLLSAVQVVVVDDGSNDGTAKALEQFLGERPASGKLSWTLLKHEANRGKGAALRTAIGAATGDISAVYDADMEYYPRDVLRAVEVLVAESADAVFGSRFAGGEVRRVMLYRHQLGNRLINFACNLVTNWNLTDVGTGCKVVRTALLKSIPLVSDDFRIEQELAIKLAKRQARLFEVAISYAGRTYEEGKKVSWRDGVLALWAILRFALSDSIYCADEYGSQILARLARARRYNAWMADTIAPYCGESVLEIGSGVGNLTQKLIPRRRYVASDINPLYLETLANLKANRPYLSVTYTDVTELASFPTVQGPFDTVVCLNVVEHVKDDHAPLQNIKSVLSPRGCAVVLVPHGQWNFGTLDEVLGHCRRYSKESLSKLAQDCGLRVREMLEFNRVGTVAWFLNGRILRRRHFGLLQVSMLNLLTPLFRLVDRFLPLPGLSLIAVLERNQG